MISKISHHCIFVLNQDSAYDFYVNKLGFKIVTDAKFDKGRWLTVCPKGMEGFELVLMEATKGMMFDEASAEAMRGLLNSGKMGGASYECEDIYATYEEMKAKGVKFTKEPTKEFYGVAAVFVDDSGNWASLTEKKK
ncbi:MAG: VOC family protein [Bacteroidetes bacterium]|nr:VOC family protein [Bacteroidota bacterium]